MFALFVIVSLGNVLAKFAREYWSFREELSVEDGLLFKSDRLVVPRPLRAEVLDRIHGAHLGENKRDVKLFTPDRRFATSSTVAIRS